MCYCVKLVFHQKPKGKLKHFVFHYLGTTYIHKCSVYHVESILFLTAVVKKKKKNWVQDANYNNQKKKQNQPLTSTLMQRPVVDKGQVKKGGGVLPVAYYNVSHDKFRNKPI